MEFKRKELEQYLIEEAKEFLRKKGRVLELIEADYDDVPEKVKESIDKVEKGYKENWLKNFTFISVN